MIVVSNTSPLRYLITVGQSDLIQNLFGHLLIPRAVEKELTHSSAPAVVRQWMTQRPAWIEVRDLGNPPDLSLIRHLDSGEAEAIQLTLDLNSDLLLIDERVGRQMASARGITVVGILGILLESHQRGSLHQPLELLRQLQSAGFRVSRRLLTEFQHQTATPKKRLP